MTAEKMSSSKATVPASKMLSRVMDIVTFLIVASTVISIVVIANTEPVIKESEDNRHENL
jgi:hypothetical protein